MKSEKVLRRIVKEEIKNVVSQLDEAAFRKPSISGKFKGGLTWSYSVPWTKDSLKCLEALHDYVMSTYDIKNNREPDLMQPNLVSDNYQVVASYSSRSEDGKYLSLDVFTLTPKGLDNRDELTFSIGYRTSGDNRNKTFKDVDNFDKEMIGAGFRKL